VIVLEKGLDQNW